MKEPNLDQWTTAFALVAFLGLFIAPLLYSQASQRKHQVGYVVAILVLFSTVLLYYVLWWSHYLQFVPWLGGFVEPLFLLFGPLFYLYLRNLARQPVRGEERWAHFAPYALSLVLSVGFLLANPGKAQAAGPSGDGSFMEHYYLSLPWLGLLQLLGYGVAMLRLQPVFGSLQHVARWAHWLTACYWGFVLANVAYYLLVRLPFFNRGWDYGISLAMSAFIFMVAVLAYVQPHIFQTNQAPGFAPEPAAKAAELVPEPAVVGAEPAALPTVRYQNSGLPERVALQQAQRLEQLMRVEKLYRLNELRLDTLAERLGMSRHHLSQVLNEQLGLSFFEYVNALRIAEAQVLLRNTSRQQLNIIEVAYEVGFNNKVSFNKAFKAATGLTPTEFRQQVNGNSDKDCSVAVAAN
jgi:AraC-like DNA-binding protein